MSLEVRRFDSTSTPQEVIKGSGDSERLINGEHPRSQEKLTQMGPEEIKQVQSQEADAIEMEMRKINEFIRPKSEALEPQDQWPDERIPSQTTFQETVEREGKSYRVAHVQRAFLGPALGMAYFDTSDCVVRDDLPSTVKNFVKEHELYHLRDPHTWGGWIGSEIRANIIPGMKDPIGLAATIFYSLNPERLRFYWKRFKEGF